MEKNICSQILADEFLSRKSKNHMYSVRAFARDLNMGSTSLSDALNGKRKLSPKNMKKVAQKLGLSPEKLHQMLQSHKKSPTKEVNKKELERLYLEEDQFNLIAHWYYFGILNLAKIRPNSAQPRWVATRLGISQMEAQTAIERLVRLKLLKIENGCLERSSAPISTTRDIPSRAIKRFNHDLLELAHTSLERDNVDEREFSSVVMAIDPAMLPKVKDLLMKTKRKVSNILESKAAKRVYLLAFQLIPLSKDEQHE